MVVDVGYWTKVLKRILAFALAILGIYLSFTLAIFYIPFLIAFVISLLVEPMIKYVAKKTKLSRKTSAIIVLSVVSVVIVALLVVGIISIISESSNLLQGLNGYIDKIYNKVQEIISSINFDKIRFSDKISEILNSSSQNFLAMVSTWIGNVLNKIVQSITKLPTFGIYVGITLVSTYFICTDKLYILDQIEHHLPRTWVKRLMMHLRDLVSSLGSYLKAEFILVRNIICNYACTVFI